MLITTTSAAALAANSALSSFEPTERTDALVVLSILAGAFMIAAALLRLGRYTRFVSHSVMLGFLTGISVNIVLGQLPDLFGVTAEGDTNLAKAIDVVSSIGDASLASLLVGLGAIAIIVLLDRTRAATMSPLVALVVPTAIVAILDADVARADDGGPIPTGLPDLAWPHLALLDVDLVLGALAVTGIVLVQGAGVAESAPNADGRSDPNRDFFAQGVGNVASGFLRGIPVGGSVGQTAINVNSGARSRWASIFAGLWMLSILLAFSSVVGVVAVPTLAAILIVAAIASVRPAVVITVLRTGWIARTAFVLTFVATLFLSVPAAVGLGLVISLLLQLNQDAIDLNVVQLARRGDEVVERRAPDRLDSHEVTVLDAYGSLFYAGARTLQARLPDPTGSTEPVVVLRLRGRTTLGATFFHVIATYAERLDAVGGALYLTGLDSEIADRIAVNPEIVAGAHIYAATDIRGESTRHATDDATAWLVSRWAADEAS